MGELLIATERAKGTAGMGRPKIGARLVRVPKKAEPTLAELGITWDESSQAQRLAEAPGMAKISLDFSSFIKKNWRGGENMKAKKIYTLRELRLARGLTLQQVADQVGASMTTIHVLETSKEGRQNYSILLKHKLSDFYGIPLRLLFPEVVEQANFLLGKTRKGASRQVQMFLPHGYGEDSQKD